MQYILAQKQRNIFTNKIKHKNKDLEEIRKISVAKAIDMK